jgi:F-type H+-transporting ATPase subunit b
MDYSNPETWVLIGLILFFLVVFFMGVPGKLWKSLGATGAAVRAELDEAVRIRQEAQDLLNSIKSQRLAAEQKARDIIAQAETDAKVMAEEAKTKLTESLKRRQDQAEKKIAQAEARAEADVKAAAADMAAQIAEAVLVAQAAKAKSDPLIDKAIGQVATRFS